ncbi:unnamed protein product [Urochloa humidicola]
MFGVNVDVNPGGGVSTAANQGEGVHEAANDPINKSAVHGEDVDGTQRRPEVVESDVVAVANQEEKTVGECVDDARENV